MSSSVSCQCASCLHTPAAPPPKLHRGHEHRHMPCNTSPQLLCTVPCCAALPAAEGQSKQVEEKPVYAFAPVLQDHTWLWQFLHSVLMLLSFCFLLPLGSLLARHRWIFGRDPLSVSGCDSSCSFPACSSQQHLFLESCLLSSAATKLWCTDTLHTTSATRFTRVELQCATTPSLKKRLSTLKVVVACTYIRATPHRQGKRTPPHDVFLFISIACCAVVVQQGHCCRLTSAVLTFTAAT